jgi:hypothetical protein
MPAHKHAEKMMQYAQDALQSETPWKLWEFKHTADTRWVACELNPVWQERDEYRRKPLKQVIDWELKGDEVPALAISESGAVAFLTLDLDAVGPSLYLSLETGLWVFNHNGTNPWPEGVLVYYKLRDAHRESGAPVDARRLNWVLTCMSTDIIASRAVGLAEGWCYE